MKLNIALENMSSCTDVPGEADVYRWVSAALSDYREAAELHIRLVDEKESAELNERYRHKNGATNVLSFPTELPEVVQAELECPLLGDLVICAPVVAKEAQQQHKTTRAHWAHMVVHGSLHLIGYDHINNDEASEMEQLETSILSDCGFPNPYQSIS